MSKKEELKEQILRLTREYYQEVHAKAQDFVPGKTKVNYGGRYFDDREMVNLVDASLDFWLTAGPWAHRFEVGLAKWLGVTYCSLCNSGSSANLLAFSALTAHELGDRAIKRGDEVITVAAGFPTTVSAILQYHAVPVFVDMRIEDSNIDVTQLEAALSPKTKAVMIAHSLGNPFDLQAVVDFCREHRLWLVEDNCDALGSEYLIDGQWKKTGTIGDIGTSSFYPPHHMTMGEGGAVYTDNALLHKLVNSFRDWGRDCWDAGYTRTELTTYLEEHKVQTRNLFAGNLLRHPAFEQYVEGVDYRVVGGSLPVTDRVMNDCFWIGVYPGMTREKLQYMIDTIRQFVAEKTACR